nr:hypothetical protein [uncultured Helicobacter sp.]
MDSRFSTKSGWVQGLGCVILDSRFCIVWFVLFIESVVLVDSRILSFLQVWARDCFVRAFEKSEKSLLDSKSLDTFANASV